MNQSLTTWKVWKLKKRLIKLDGVEDRTWLISCCPRMVSEELCFGWGFCSSDVRPIRYWSVYFPFPFHPSFVRSSNGSLPSSNAFPRPRHSISIILHLRRSTLKYRMNSCNEMQFLLRRNNHHIMLSNLNFVIRVKRQDNQAMESIWEITQSSCGEQPICIITLLRVTQHFRFPSFRRIKQQCTFYSFRSFLFIHCKQCQ